MGATIRSSEFVFKGVTLVQTVAQPSPCSAGYTYQITPSGGSAPYTFQLIASPPNPPGLQLSVPNGVAHVQVPAGTTSGASIVVVVTDSGTPPQTGYSINTVA